MPQGCRYIHHLITLPTYHTAALSTDNLAGYFGEQGMLVHPVSSAKKSAKIIACVKHQNMAGSDMGDDHKECFAGRLHSRLQAKRTNQF